jgi:diacylglycerol kinase family enzyme
MAAERVSILYNPSAGMGRALDRKIKLERLLKHFGIRYDLIMTQSEDHLRRLTRERAAGSAAIVGAGGDSTFHIMIDEIVRTGAKTTFGMIGVGSSNDIPLEFGLHSLWDACLALRDRRTRRVDLGRIAENGEAIGHFLGQANVGLGAYVNTYVAGVAERKHGLARKQTLAGLLGILKAYRTGALPWKFTVASEGGRREGEFSAAVFSNIRFWATGKMINPGALPDDGALDACFIGRASFLRLARINAQARKGRHGRSAEVSFERAPAFTISSEDAFVVQSDGEIVRAADGRTTFREVRIDVEPRALEIIVP